MTMIWKQRRKAMASASTALLLSVGLLAVAPSPWVTAAPSTDVIINEVRCDDAKPDFVELYNFGTTTVNLDGWVIADHIGDLTDTVHVKALPAINLGPKKYTKIYKGTRATEFKFNIACGADKIKLATVSGSTSTTLDSVAIPPLSSGFSWSRLTTAPKGWGVGLPTAGAKNKPAPADASYDQTSWIFDPNITKRIDLTLPNATLTDFQNGNQGNVYQPGTFRMTNQSTPSSTPAPIQVGVRLKKGYGSYLPFGSLQNPSKSSFKIKFDSTVPEQRFFGLRKLTLNNMKQDPSLVHEWASYSVFRAMGIPAPRVAYASVYINNVHWGFYLTLEPFDAVSLSWNYPITEHLYEGLWTDRPPDLRSGRAAAAYNIDEGSKTNRTDLETLISALNMYSISSAQVLRYLNVDQVAKVMATEQYLNHWDGYTSTASWTPNNYYLHSDRTGRFELLPWGTDQTFGGHAADFGNAIGILFNKCYADTYCRSQYFKAIAQVSTVANSLGLGQSIATILGTQRDAIVADTARGISYVDTLGAGAAVSWHIGNATTEASNFLKYHTYGTITWTPPTNLRAGQKLTASFFDAYSDTAGTFKYSVAVGRLLKAGTLKVIVTFTPSDIVKYAVRKNTYNVVVAP